LGAGLLMAEMLLFFIPALMSLLDYGACCAMTAGAFCW
jgi:holin-like protein